MSKFEEAAHFALKKHAGMTRKSGSAPYILHPFEAAVIASTISDDEDVLCAAVLHDVVEDTDCTIEQVRELFGDRVAFLVASETEMKYSELPRSESWQRRKEESLEELRGNNDVDVHIIWLADKLSNMRSYARLYKLQGLDMWKIFNQSDPSRQAWYYREILGILSDLDGTSAWREFKALVDCVFGEVE